MLLWGRLAYCVAYAGWEKVILRERHTGFATIAAESSGFNMEDESRIKISCRKKSDIRWMKWMEFGHKLGCHQKPERSFFIGDYQMPVCARCTGVFAGYLAAVLWLPFLKSNKKLSNTVAVAGSLAMLTDWSLQAFKIKESTNCRRLLSGIAGGFGIMIFWIRLIRWVFTKLRA